MRYEEKSEFRKGGDKPSFRGGARRGGPSTRRPSMRPLPAKDFKIDYKNFSSLLRFVSDRGKVSSRRSTGFGAKDQRRLTEAIKIARFLALLPSGTVRK